MHAPVAGTTRHEQLLFQDQADQVARSFLRTITETPNDTQATALHQVADYFREHRNYMYYQERCDEGWPIGSGAKQFKARVAGPGMRWRRPYAERILTVLDVVITSKAHFDILRERAHAN